MVGFSSTEGVWGWKRDDRGVRGDMGKREGGGANFTFAPYLKQMRDCTTPVCLRRDAYRTHGTDREEYPIPTVIRDFCV